MNIYEEIEKCYLENNVDARLNLLFRRIFVVFFVLTMSFVFIFNLGNLINYAITVALVMFFLIVILSTLLLLIFNGKSKHLVKIGETLPFSKKLSAFFRFVHYRDEIYLLSKTLKNNGIKTKEDIKFIHSYYASKRAVSIKSSMFIEFISLSLSVAAFLVATYNPEKGVFNALPFMFLLGVGFSIIIVIINYFFNLWIFYDEKFYSEIEQRLTYIYLHFDDYFSLSKRNYSVGKKLFTMFHKFKR